MFKTTRRHPIEGRIDTVGNSKGKSIVGEKFYLGKFAESTFNTSQLLADAEVLAEDQTHITARIDSQRGLALTRPADRRPWQVWHLDLRTAFGGEAEATAAAKQKMMERPADGEKPPVWSAFLWPA